MTTRDALHSTRRICAALWLVCLPVLAGAPARADFLLLDSGDRFNGELVRVRDGLLKFKTSLSGQIMAPMSTVAELRTEAPFIFRTEDESRLYGVLTQEDGATVVRGPEGEQTPVVLAEITEAVSVPGSSSGEWSAEVGTEVRGSTGLEGSVEPGARLELRGPLGERGEASAELEVQRADSEAFPARGRGRAERLPADDTGFFASLEVERDTMNALEARTGLTLGVGRWLGTWGGFDWLTTIGIQPAYEMWALEEAVDAGALPRRYRDERATDADLNLSLGLRMSGTLTRDLSLSQELRVLSSLDDAGEVRATSETELSQALNDNLRLRLHVLLEYNSDPLLGPVDPWNASMGAGMAFEF